MSIQRSSLRGRAGADDSFLSASDPGAVPFAGAASPTHAAFSPGSSLTANSKQTRSKRRSNVLVHQKSPLLLATPPQVTRALAYSHPFLLPLNKVAALLSWTSGDAWESSLLVLCFWAVMLYGDVAIRLLGPVVIVASIILAMYGRRYSPLSSSSSWSEQPAKDPTAAAASSSASTLPPGTAEGLGGLSSPSRKDSKTIGQSPKAASNIGGGGHQRTGSVGEATSTRHQKTLDEMVETLNEFTGRCNVLLEPLLEATDFLSTQRTPTSVTTRPALTTLFLRILICTPFWFALSLPPWRIVTTRRVALLLGTLVLTWHSRVMRVTRVILWRSLTIRHIAALVTGLTYEIPSPRVGTASSSSTSATAVPPSSNSQMSDLSRALHKKRQSAYHTNVNIGLGLGGVGPKDKAAGVKFTFIIYENQRRWVLLGWTGNMFSYERNGWTDEHLNPVPSRSDFELPDVEGGSGIRWRWVSGTRWRVDGVPGGDAEEVDYDSEAGRMGWIYYDTKWQNGRRGLDGWGRWTRRRKWYRDAELVDEDASSPTNEIAVQPRQLEAVLSTSMTDSVTSPTLPEHSEPSSSTQDGSSSPSSMQPRNRKSKGGKDKGATEYDHLAPGKMSDDSSSVISTSSRSIFRPSSLIRRTTATTGTTAVAAVSVATLARAREDSRRANETSRPVADLQMEAALDDEAAALGLEVALELQGRGRDARQWGVGDEVKMGLE